MPCSQLRVISVTTLALTVNVGLAWSPAPVGAKQLAPATTTTTEPAGTTVVPAEPSGLEEAERLYHEGRAAYETFNYDAAISSWTTALARVPSTPEAANIRNAIVYNMASALRKAYELDHDVLRLKRARLLLARYLEQEQGGTSGDAEDLARVQTQMDEIDAEIAAVEAKPKPTPPPEPVPTTAPAGKPADTRARPGTAMIGVGAGLLVAGAGLLGGMAIGLVIGKRAEEKLGALDTSALENRRPDTVARGKLGNRTAIATGIVGGLALASGVALVIVGVRKRQRAKQSGSVTRIAPMFGPGTFGVMAQVRL